MRGVPAFSSRRSVSKEQASRDACIERIRLTELAIQRWRDFGAAYKTYNDQQITMTTAIAEFVRTHSSDKPQRLESAGDGEQKQDHHNVEEDKKEKEKTQTEGDDNAAAGGSTHASGTTVGATVEIKGFEELLAEFEGQFQKTIEDNSSVCKLLEIDTVQAQTTTKERSSNKLVRSFSRSFSFKIWSRSSKVRCSPSDEKKGHSSTLENLCAWEKQLYYLVERVLDEEKTGGFHEVDVAKQSAVSAFNQIQQLKDKKLKDHLDVLLRDLTHNWGKNSDCYSIQAQIMSEIIEKYTPPDRLCSDVLHWRAAKKLKAQLEQWLACFANNVSSHKAYIKALHDWERHPFPAVWEENNSTSSSSSSSNKNNKNNKKKLPLLDKWSSSLDKMFADETVTKAIGDLATKVGELVELQNKEYKRKSQVEQLKGERWKIEKSKKAKDKSDKLTQRINEEEVQYEASWKETKKKALEVVHTFTSLFKSLAESSKSFAGKYDDVKKENDAEKYDDSKKENDASAEAGY